MSQAEHHEGIHGVTIPQEDIGVGTHEELKSLGDLIRAWQDSQTPRPSDQALCNRYIQLGSTRTFKRVWTGDGIEGLNLEDWLPKYRHVWEQIQADDIEVAAEPIFDDLFPAKEASRAWVRLMGQHGLQRWVHLEGDTGSGKTFALRALKEKIGGAAYVVEAHEGWNRFRTGIKLMAEALSVRPGQGDLPQSAGDWLELVIKKLNERGRRVILIDEAHHFSGEMLNALKALITRTDCVFITAGMDTLWSKLTSANALEARQLTLNRMLFKVKLTAPSLADTKSYLLRRCGAKGADATMKRLIAASESRGGFAFLRRVAERLKRRPEGTDLGDEEIMEAINEAREDLGE